MTSVSEQQFVRQLEELIFTGEDGLRVDWDAVVEMVGANLETTAKVTVIALENAQTTPHLFRVAEILAGAYQVLAGDDSLAQLVEVARIDLGRGPTRIRVEGGEQEFQTVVGYLGARAAAREGGTVTLHVWPPQLANVDVSELLDNLSSKRAPATEHQNLRRLRAQCELSFVFEQDELREIPDIPEVRRYVSEIHRAMPYFPYYLDSSRSGALQLYLACLVDPALVDTSRGIAINMGDPTALATLAKCMMHVAAHAQTLGDDPQAALDSVFGTVCAGVLQPLLRSLTSAPM